MSPGRGKGKGLAWIMAHRNYAGDECLKWPFSTNRGYGMFGAYGKVHKAHRFMCALIHGEAPTPKHQVAHSCGRGDLGCVNPKHLRWATALENQHDRRKHGTTNKSINGRLTRLTPQQVAEIRALKGFVSQVKLAERFGMKRGGIEYWQSHDEPPNPPSMSANALYKRAKKHR